MDWNYVLLGGAVAAVLRFVWNSVCWIVLWHHMKDFRSFGIACEEVEQVIRGANLEPGYFYNLPHFSDYDGMKDPKLAARMDEGPNGFYVPYPNGNCMTGKTFLHGFLLNFVEGVFLAVLTLVLWSNTALPVAGCLQTVLALAVVGIFVAVAVHAAHSIWMLMPWRHTWHSVFDMAVGYALMGGALYGMHQMLG